MDVSATCAHAGKAVQRQNRITGKIRPGKCFFCRSMATKISSDFVEILKSLFSSPAEDGEE